MTVHWETSKKPLFVRTIWAGGHHHAVLHAQDPLVQDAPRPTTHKLSKKSSKTSAKLRICNPQESETSQYTISDELSISTVRIPPGRSHPPRCKSSYNATLNNPQEFEMRRTFTIDVLPREELKCQDIVFQPETLRLETHRLTKYMTHEDRFADISCKQLLEPIRDTSLSDRVLVWLDLARNTSNLQVPKIEAPKVTTTSFQKVYTRIPISHVVARTPTPSIASDYSSVEEVIKEGSNATLDDSLVEGGLQINSIVETNYQFRDGRTMSAPRANCFRHDTKRQLHIFLPDVIKKGGDTTDSIISSQISSV